MKVEKDLANSLITIGGASFNDGDTVVITIKNKYDGANYTEDTVISLPIKKDVSKDAVQVLSVNMVAGSKKNTDANGNLVKGSTFEVQAILADAMGYNRTSQDDVIYNLDSTNVIEFSSPDASDSTKKTKTAKGNVSVELKANGAGTATITAYLKKYPTKSASLTVEVKSKAQVGIYLGKEVYDAANYTYTAKTTKAVTTKEILTTDGAEALTPSELKAQVRDQYGKVTEDVSVTFDYGTGANAKKIFATLTAAKDKPGRYTIVIFKGTLDDEASIRSEEIIFTASKSTIISKIELAEDFKENELSLEKEVTKKLVITNENGEELVVDKSLLSANIENTAFTVTFDTSADGKNNIVKIKGSKEGTAKVVLNALNANSGTVAASLPLSLTVVAKSYIAEMVMDEDVNVVNKDAFYVTLPVTFNDQYGYAMNVGKTQAGDLIDLATKPSDIKVGLYNKYDYSNGKETATEADDAGNYVKLIGFKANYMDAITGNNTKTDTVTFKGNDNSGKTVLNHPVKVVVKADRVLDKLQLKQYSMGSTTGTPGSKIGLSWQALDQYGEAFKITVGQYGGSDAITKVLVSDPSGVITPFEYQCESGTKAEGYYAVKGDVEGTYSGIKVYYDADNDGKWTTGEKYFTLPAVTIASAATSVKSLSINDTVNVFGTLQQTFSYGSGYFGYNANIGEAYGGLKYDTSKYLVNTKAYEPKDEGNYSYTYDKPGDEAPNANIVFDLTAKDADNKTLKIKTADDITWRVKSAEIKYADGTAMNTSAIKFSAVAGEGNVLVIPKQDDVYTGTITVEAETKNQVKAEKTIKVSTAEETITNGAYFVSSSNAVKKAAGKTITTLTLDADKIMGSAYVYGYTQYGTVLSAADRISSVASMDENKLLANLEADNKITVKALEAGTANVSIVFKNGDSSLTLPVKATKGSPLVPYVDISKGKAVEANSEYDPTTGAFTVTANYKKLDFTTDNANLFGFNKIKATIKLNVADKAKFPYNMGKFAMSLLKTDGTADSATLSSTGGLVYGAEKNGMVEATFTVDIPADKALNSNGVRIQLNEVPDNPVIIESIQFIK